MNNRFQTFLLFFTFSLCGLTGCGQIENDKSINTAKDPLTYKCIPTQSSCVIDTELGQFEVQFNVDKIESESPFNIQVRYLGDHKLEKITGYIEGVDMFMGKIPLFFSINENTHSSIDKVKWHSDAMIGSCSENEMRWAIWIKAEFEQKEPIFFIEFTSQNSN